MDQRGGVAERVKDSRHATEYLLQVALVYIVVVVSLVNLSFGVGSGELWKYLLLTFIGIFLPTPRLHRRHRDSAEEIQLPESPIFEAFVAADGGGGNRGGEEPPAAQQAFGSDNGQRRTV